MVIIHIEESNKQHRHTHALVLIYSFIHFVRQLLLFCWIPKNKMKRKKIAQRHSASISTENEKKRGKQNDKMLCDYYLANWNNETQNKHQTLYTHNIHTRTLVCSYTPVYRRRSNQKFNMFWIVYSSHEKAIIMWYESMDEFCVVYA